MAKYEQNDEKREAIWKRSLWIALSINGIFCLVSGDKLSAFICSWFLFAFEVIIFSCIQSVILKVDLGGDEDEDDEDFASIDGVSSSAFSSSSDFTSIVTHSSNSGIAANNHYPH